MVAARRRRGADRDGGDAQPVVDGRVHRLAGRVLRPGVGERLHAPAGKRRRRVPRTNVRRAHHVVEDGAVLIAGVVPVARAGVRVRPRVLLEPGGHLGHALRRRRDLPAAPAAGAALRRHAARPARLDERPCGRSRRRGCGGRSSTTRHLRFVTSCSVTS